MSTARGIVHRALIDKLAMTHALTQDEMTELIAHFTPEDSAYLCGLAREVALQHFGNVIYTRGLIEFTNICRNDCYYCGIRKSNRNVTRYRLTQQQILDCCRTGHALGFRTFVLQGGEDAYFDDARMEQIVRAIKAQHPGCAVTLSIGERSEASYQRLFDAGADRFLLRHETANVDHYQKLHPPALSARHRQDCLRALKRIGYQTGTGFMVGSPYQTPALLAEDLAFIAQLRPEMVGIGPFIPHRDTPLADQRAGTLELTVFLLGVLRLMMPDVLLPATTALGTIADDGRERGILAGANVVMPNLSPRDVRKQYALYDNKISTGAEAAEGRDDLQRRMQAIGYTLGTGRGDYRGIDRHLGTH